MSAGKTDPLLFPTDLAGPQWLLFKATGYDKPVCGAIFRSGQADHGMPLGGLATGYVNLDTDGRLGNYTLFNRVLTKNGKIRQMNMPERRCSTA